MKRPNTPAARHAYTLVEILTATVLMSIIMVFVTYIFGSVAESIGLSRANLEMNQRTRSAAALIKQDLENATAVANPPLHPRANQGYFQYAEGPIGPVINPWDVALNLETSLPDTTMGDIDDVLMFTVKTKGEPYRGLIGGVAAASDTAEIIYFVRGTTLYRRVLLVKPDVDVSSATRAGFYATNDLSVRKFFDNSSNVPILKANSLADLTRPECRTFHNPDLRTWTEPRPTTSAAVGPKLARNDNSLRYRREGKPFPHFLRPWLGSPCDVAGGALVDPPLAGFRWAPGLGLPTLAECSDPNWIAGNFVPSENPVGININDPSVIQMPRFAATIAPTSPYDPWANAVPWAYINPSSFAVEPTSAVDPITAISTQFAGGTRVGEDVLMTNVIGFDVKAWDPRAAVLTRHIFASGSEVDQVTVQPGDPGYFDAVSRLPTNISAVTGAYVDLNYMARYPRSGSVYPDATAVDGNGTTIPIPTFHAEGNHASLAYGTRSAYAVIPNQQPYCFSPALYDTWSLHFEYNRQTISYVSENSANNTRWSATVGNEDNDAEYDEGTDGLDNDTQNGVDDVGERETLPPYNVPLQGIQIRLRVFEPASRQVREVTIVQKFRTK